MAKLIKVKPEVIAIDAFYGGEGHGNLAGVCILQEALPETEMQRIAKDFGASETAFVVKSTGDDTLPLSLRWFTPTQEVALCGHGTLASAYSLWEKNIVNKSQKISFKTLSGVLTCTLNENGKIQMAFPELFIEPSHVAPSTLVALGIDKPLYVGVSEKYVLVEIENEEELRALKPDFQALKKVVQRGFLVTCKSKREPYDFISRCFFPKEGIPEDPVTGSAHCTLGPYWKRKLGKDTLLAYQASISGGELGISFDKKTVLLSGLARFSNTISSTKST